MKHYNTLNNYVKSYELFVQLISINFNILFLISLIIILRQFNINVILSTQRVKLEKFEGHGYRHLPSISIY